LRAFRRRLKDKRSGDQKTRKRREINSKRKGREDQTLGVEGEDVKDVEEEEGMLGG